MENTPSLLKSVVTVQDLGAGRFQIDSNPQLALPFPLAGVGVVGLVVLGLSFITSLRLGGSLVAFLVVAAMALGLFFNQAKGQTSGSLSLDVTTHTLTRIHGLELISWQTEILPNPAVLVLLPLNLRRHQSDVSAGVSPVYVQYRLGVVSVDSPSALVVDTLSQEVMRLGKETFNTQDDIPFPGGGKVLISLGNADLPRDLATAISQATKLVFIDGSAQVVPTVLRP